MERTATMQERSHAILRRSAAGRACAVLPPGTSSSVDRPRTPATGLTEREVAARVDAGQVNATTAQTSRTLAEILRANVFTVFNGLLTVLFVVALAAGQWQNALFGGVVVANAGIGIVQELRAKRTLDRLAVLNAPRARVVRDGIEADLPVGDVVLDDLLGLVAG